MAKLQRVGPDHPEACQSTTTNGACVYQRESGSQYCSLHGGGNAPAASERKELRNYRLNSAYAGRAAEHANSPVVKNLTDEIALMRTALEVVFNSIKNENEMVLYIDKIEKMTKGIQGLIATLQKLQEANKELLGRDTVMLIFDLILEKIVEKVDDADVIRALADDCYAVIIKHTGG